MVKKLPVRKIERRGFGVRVCLLPLYVFGHGLSYLCGLQRRKEREDYEGGRRRTVEEEGSSLVRGVTWAF